MKILVCGGRDYSDYNRVANALGSIHRKYPIKRLIHGGCRGADSLAGEWAKKNGVVEEVFLALWKRDGKAAGPIRNQRMLEKGAPDAAVAFKGGRGTEDMVMRLKAAGIPVWEVE